MNSGRSLRPPPTIVVDDGAGGTDQILWSERLVYALIDYPVSGDARATISDFALPAQSLTALELLFCGVSLICEGTVAGHLRPKPYPG
jgi:hypothetical protein